MSDKLKDGFVAEVRIYHQVDGKEVESYGSASEVSETLKEACSAIDRAFPDSAKHLGKFYPLVLAAIASRAATKGESET